MNNCDRAEHRTWDSRGWRSLSLLLKIIGSLKGSNWVLSFLYLEKQLNALSSIGSQINSGLLWWLKEKAVAPNSSTLAWKIPWTEEPGRLQFMGLRRVGHCHFSLSCIGEGSGNPLQCSCLENPRDGGAWWAAVYGVAQSRTRLKRLSRSSSSWGLRGKESTCQCRKCRFDPWAGKIPWRRKWQPSILAWEIPWTEKPGELPSMGLQKSQMWLSD